MNEFVNFSLYQNILTLCIIFISYALVIFFGSKTKYDIRVNSFIFFWHTLFAVVYYWYSLSSSADAKGYFKDSLIEGYFSLKPGSQLITYITSFFSQGFFKFSYLNTTLAYNFIGVLGLVFFYKSIKPILIDSRWYWTLILFIPSMSFWSSGLGKEPFAFLGVCLFLYSVTQLKTNKFLISAAFISMFMVRPHVAFLMLVSFVIYFIIRARVHLIFKIISLPAIFGAVFLSLNYVQGFVGLEDASLDSMGAYIDQRQGYNLEGGSSVDIASMSYPMQMFTYIFRPLPFDANSLVALITSIENSIILLLFIYILIKSKVKVFIQDKNIWLIIYVILSCSALALVTANLGIATRQKWMFMPVLIYLLIYALHDYKTKKI